MKTENGVTALVDVIQKHPEFGKGILQVPEIRVWCHPEKIGETGTDTFKVFESFQEAIDFITTHKEAEEQPLIAFRGWEINLWDIKPPKKSNGAKNWETGRGIIVAVKGE